MKVLMLTTKDNPYDPFTEYEKWNNYDVQQGYHTNAYLARVTAYSDDLTEVEKASAIKQGIDEIIEFNPTGNYVVVEKEIDNVEVIKEEKDN